MDRQSPAQQRMVKMTMEPRRKMILEKEKAKRMKRMKLKRMRAMLEKMRNHVMCTLLKHKNGDAL